MKESGFTSRESQYISIVYKDSATKLNDLEDVREVVSFDSRGSRGKRGGVGLSLRAFDDAPKYFDLEKKRGGSPIRKVLKAS